MNAAGLPGESGGLGPVGPPGRDGEKGEKGPRGKRGKRVKPRKHTNPSVLLYYRVFLISLRVLPCRCGVGVFFLVPCSPPPTHPLLRPLAGLWRLSVSFVSAPHWIRDDGFFVTHAACT